MTSRKIPVALEICCFPLLGLMISSLVFKASKYLTKLTMILQYQTSVTESTANGRISLFAILALYVIFIWSVAGSSANSVNMFHKIINLALLLAPRWMFQSFEVQV